MGIKYSQPLKRDQLYFSIPLPLDKDGFVTSFDVENYKAQEVKQFFDNFGLVIFKNVITEEQVQKTIDDLWNQVKQLYDTQQVKIDRNDPNTWKFMGMTKAYGFVNNKPISQPQFWRNRANPQVYKAFKDLYKITSGKDLNQPLIACFDRGSLIRPSKLNPDWQTASIYHFDIDPWYWTGVQQHTMQLKYKQTIKEYSSQRPLLSEGCYQPNVGYTKLAAVLALSDAKENSGGFQASCGFQNYIKKWCQLWPYGTHIESDQQLLKTFQKVYVRKGSLIVFSRQLPHNIYPNKSQNFRYAQYLRMTPQSTLCLNKQQKQRRKALVKSMVPKQLQRTQICKQIFMLDDDQTDQKVDI